MSNSKVIASVCRFAQQRTVRASDTVHLFSCDACPVCVAEIVDRVAGWGPAVKEDTFPDVKSILWDDVVARGDPVGGAGGADAVFRPDVKELVCQDFLIMCMRDCWSENPEWRPDFRTIRSRLKNFRQGM